MKRTKLILIRHAVLLAPNQVRFDRVKNFATPLVETLICQKLCIRKKPEQIVLLSIASSKSREKGFFYLSARKWKKSTIILSTFFPSAGLEKERAIIGRVHPINQNVRRHTSHSHCGMFLSDNWKEIVDIPNRIVLFVDLIQLSSQL